MLHPLWLLADASQPAWWVVAGGVMVAALTTLNRVLDSFEFRQRTARELGAMRERDNAQQILIERQEKRIDALETQLAEKNIELSEQRRLKNACIDHLQAAICVVSLYRKLHGQHDDDGLDIEAIVRSVRRPLQLPLPPSEPFSDRHPGGKEPPPCSKPSPASVTPSPTGSAGSSATSSRGGTAAG